MRQANMHQTGLWQAGWREQFPLAAQEQWDCIIIGGGITGAGILLEASRRGWKALLLEQRDFAWGTSSRSSKLVHGGLRYLKQGQFGLTLESVRERQHLLQQAAGLVEPQGFVLADVAGRKPGRWMISLGLAIYDFMAGPNSPRSRYHGAADLCMLAPNIARTGLKGGVQYQDAKTDDARLVLRVLQEALSLGGQAFNYVQVPALVRENGGDGQPGQPVQDGKVCGVVVQDSISGQRHEIKARLVISATGAWADQLRPQGAARVAQKIRPLRGSHLLFPAWRLPVAQAVSLMHPQDGRPVFAYPWEGMTLVGTTDVDHNQDLQQEAVITPGEADYLMAALHFQFPTLNLHLGDAVASYAGVRPVIDTGKSDPSKEGRDHVLWLEQGLLTVAGGKLTTFRTIAHDALQHALKQMPDLANLASLPGHDNNRRKNTASGQPQGRSGPTPIFAASPTPQHPLLSPAQLLRLQGRYGAHAASLLEMAHADELQMIQTCPTLWVELRWAARFEAVLHLEDLLLRRTRLGLQLAGGGVAQLARIRAICQPELGWDDVRWEQEQADYLSLWQKNYRVPNVIARQGE
jgi:glycerol-3-phosphate dehydrogenase